MRAPTAMVMREMHTSAPSSFSMRISHTWVVRPMCSIRAVPVTTGLTDYDYSAVREGLSPGDTVLILPTAGLLQDQAHRAIHVAVGDFFASDLHKPFAAADSE